MPLKFQNQVTTIKQKAIVLVFAVTGPLFLLGSVKDEMKHRHIVSNGVKTTAKVLKSTIEHPHEGPDRARVEVTYVADKKQREGTIYMGGDDFEALENKKSLPVLYAKDNPGNIELQNGGSDAWLGVLSGLVMSVIGLWGIAPSLGKKKVDLSKA
ncbi:hypothetical protein EON80_21530 [bacterium]|nr:MAG: hypothetical protein EON80_21530 [bacterium]